MLTEYAFYHEAVGISRNEYDCKFVEHATVDKI